MTEASNRHTQRFRLISQAANQLFPSSTVHAEAVRVQCGTSNPLIAAGSEHAESFS